MTAWNKAQRVVEAFRAMGPGGQCASETEHENRYGSIETWYEDGDRLRLVVNPGDEDITLYVFERTVRANRTALEQGILEYEVRLGAMPLSVALATLEAARTARD